MFLQHWRNIFGMINSFASSAVSRLVIWWTFNDTVRFNFPLYLHVSQYLLHKCQNESCAPPSLWYGLVGNIVARQGHIPTVHWLTIWCILHTKMASSLSIWQALIWLAGFFAASKCQGTPAWSHGNSYVFYEVAILYEFVRTHSYKFIWF